MLHPSSFDSNFLRNLSVTNTLTENNETQAWIRHSQATVHCAGLWIVSWYITLFTWYGHKNLVNTVLTVAMSDLAL